MKQEESPPHYPRDKEALLRDLTLVGRLKDIRDQASLRERLAPKWWEAVVGIVQFAAALGLLASLMQHPELKADPFARLALFWGGLMILALVLGFESVIFRLHHLRRAHDLLLRRCEDLSHRLEQLEKPGAGDDDEERP